MPKFIVSVWTLTADGPRLKGYIAFNDKDNAGYYITPNKEAADRTTFLNLALEYIIDTFGCNYSYMVEFDSD
jgi:hypothetical protein